MSTEDIRPKPLTDRERVITNFCKFLYYEDEISGDIKEELIEKLKEGRKDVSNNRQVRHTKKD